ncbi:MAG: hypothetical protein M1368_09760 [Thaumarchaeota archaeon]|nr:hypothetical protein [Nitrososphaerota archaeon]
MSRAARAVSLGTVSVIVIALILIVGLGVYINATFNTRGTTASMTSATQSSTSGSPTSSTESGESTGSGTVSTSGNSTTYAVSNPNLGIRLVISLNASTVRLGGAVNYSASVYNTRSSVNNVSSASNWAIPDLIETATGPTDSPIAYAVMPGYYVSSNISKAPGIDYGICCTTVAGGLTVYSFQPMSDVASVFGSCSLNPCFTKPVSTWRLLSEYPTGVGAEVHWVNFTSGVYTVVAEDEWGDVALASFTVR